MSEHKFEGGKELEEALFALPSSISNKIGRFALRKAAKPIAELASELAPDDPRTGGIDLKRSIKASVSAKVGRSRKRVKAAPGTQEMHVGPTKDGYPQAIMQEFGTIHHPPQAYLRPAWDRLGGIHAMEIIGTELGKAIKRAMKKL